MARHRFFTLCPEILCAIGYDGFFKRVNPAFTETLGYSNRELRKIGLIELVDKADQETVRNEMEELVGNGQTREFELRCLCANGDEKWLAWRAKPYPEDKVIYAAARDITEKKRADERLRNYNLELKELSCAAEAATRAKSEILANVSHELRTPMTAILTIAEVLRSGQWDQAQLEAIATIERNGKYLLTLINEVLDLSKIEAGKLSVECVPCSICEVIEDVESLIAVRAAEKGLTLHVRMEGDIPQQVYTDPTRLQQILINLTENAVKFTDQGSVTVTVKAEQQEGRVRLHFAVADTGIGMTRRQLDNLFEPFTQGDSSTTRRFGGTGLGLSISYQLTQLLGGDISVTSSPDRGSTFHLWIDAGPATASAPLVQDGTRRSPPVEKPASALPDLSGCKVLLAEDYLDIRVPVTFVLEQAGAQVVAADNGRAAVDLALEAHARAEPFDVVLMDMQMPLVDGYTATRELREAGYPGCIVAITAHAMESDRQKCLAAGCDEYVPKPIDIQRMTALIRAVMSAPVDVVMR